ncbi:protein phosphatase, Mg2+/Mn2+ dependent, 1Lb isoform X3 [Rhinichthys klamathensis goyatoka]|uniref:protein phosphatase, Mg2+/Mn2+ dependent, 1Lb isoform X3 n=1 Tax=Rhinichthys klamathensis goyatoka TaxID=3034132 RepID=UPI0024B4B414|nr:protein phosphatase, Mg2+/Mn2+ dependent, 1Lb isoform X3 [Rhinichthys klamathensis goyatoka]
MSVVSLLARIMRSLLLRPETLLLLLLLCVSLALWSFFFFHTEEVKTIVRSSRDVVHMMKGRVREMMLEEQISFSRTWQFRSSSAAVYSIQGRRDHMEDRFLILTDTLNYSHPDIFGIFDGHGGKAAAEYAKSHLPVMLRQQLQKENSARTPQSVLRQQILNMDKEMLEKLSASYDEAGGFISFNGSWRVQGVLAMSRSLGDYPLKKLKVLIPDPDVLNFDLDKLQPQFMILASDGLWDAFSSEEAVHFIKERLDEPHFGAKSIVLQSFYRGCPDNITVMVVKFRKRGSKAAGQ